MEHDTPAVAEAVAEEGAVAETVAEEETVAEAGPSIDDLLGAEVDDPLLNAEHNGLPAYQDILARIPEDGRRLMGNMRAAFTRKTQELAELRRSLEAERAEFQRQRSVFANSDAAKAIAEGLSALVEQRAAAMVAKLMQPLQEDLAAQQRRSELDAFKRDHPDMVEDSELKSSIVDMLKSNPDMRLETAYWAARGQLGARRSALEAERAERELRQQTSTGRRVNGATRRAARPRSAWDAYLDAKAQQDRGNG
jgi:exonuclease VII large subunit